MKNEDIYKIIRWWENELSDDERTKYLIKMFPLEKTWVGSKDYRYEKLLEVYKNR